jgi:hypothetical protein
MELEKEDVIVKQKYENRIKRQTEYNRKKYLKDPNVLKRTKKKQLLYKQINHYESPNRQPKPIYMHHQKEWYDKQRESRKNPFLRSNHGEFILTFN